MSKADSSKYAQFPFNKGRSRTGPMIRILSPSYSDPTLKTFPIIRLLESLNRRCKLIITDSELKIPSGR